MSYLQNQQTFEKQKCPKCERCLGCISFIGLKEMFMCSKM